MLHPGIGCRVGALGEPKIGLAAELAAPAMRREVRSLSQILALRRLDQGFAVRRALGTAFAF